MSIHLLRRARIADQASGLSAERLSLLSVLAFAGQQNINRLAEIESVSAPAISRIVSALEKAGLAKRTRSDKDARTVIVAATAKGKRLVENGRRRRLELIAEELKTLSKRDLAQLRKIAHVLEDSRSGN